MDDAPALPDRASAQVPADVATLASERQLGDLRAVHGDANPFVVGGVALLLGTAAVAVGALGGAAKIRPLVIVAFLAGALAVVMLLVALGTAVLGRRECHLFHAGFVYRRNRRLRAVTWPEVAKVTAQAGRGLRRGRSDGGWVVATYRVELRDGTKVRLPVGDVRPTARPFQEHFEQLVDGAGIPLELQMMGAR